MGLFPNLKYRSHEKEDMDQLDLDGPQMEKTLDGLSRVNRLFGNTSVTIKEVSSQLLGSGLRAARVVDLGCGGGDNLRALYLWSKKQGLDLELLGIDGNANILNHAAQQDGERVGYQQADILSTEFELPECDILISSHFLYRFSDDELANFLKGAQQKVSTAIIFTDLQRSTLSYALFRMFSAVMPFNNMVKADGLRAIKRSFRRSELEQILSKAGFDHYQLRWKWAFRYLISMNLQKKS